MAFIKSHSNFVLKKKHQRLDDGLIYERDYTTIGGVNSFSAKQIPIYQSGNFLITINSDEISRKPFADEKWEENENGTIWSYSDVSNASANTAYVDNQIVLKNDYYKLSDFAYFGSCSELIRGSVNGILQSFPGELFVSNATLEEARYSISSITDDYDDYLYIENPFNIDIYTKWITDDNDEKQLKFLAANEHWKNYQIIKPNGDECDFEIEVESADTICNKAEIEYAINKKLPIPSPRYKDGSLVYTVKISSSGLSGVWEIVCLKYDTRLVYFTKNKWNEYHIRPKEKFLDKFYQKLDSFQYLLLNPKSEPKYTIYLEVLSKGDYGYLSKIESFTFPTANGGYNIGGSEMSLNTYLSKFITYTEFYDEHFSDNLYRMMTHDSIKNFDWSYYIDNNQAEEFVENGEKLSQIIRLFGREFDEIKFYIDGINHYNQITYNDRNNIPDYFLTDELETDGWDIKQIYPLSLSEYITGCTEDKGNFKSFRIIDGYCFLNEFDDFQVNEIKEPNNIVIGGDGNQYKLFRLFNQDTKSIYYPYRDRLKYPFGYFYICSGSTEGGYDDCNGKYGIIPANKWEKFYIDSGRISGGDSKSKMPRTVIRTRNKKFSDEKGYSTIEINRLFLKRLKLNSRHILKHKGTIQGVEMIFGMFGMISKNFLENYKFTDSFTIDKNEWDYDIKEYTTFSNPILDPYYCCKGMPRIDWYNSTKIIQYDTADFRNNIYHPYQGLPVSYRDRFFEVEKTSEGYELKGDMDEAINEVIKYNPSTFTLTYFDNEWSIQTAYAYRYRNIYPYFNANDEYDGRPYYQMNGGWLCNSPYSFDKDNNIMSDGYCVFTETLNTLKVLDNVQQLVDIPVLSLENGEIYKVNSLDGEFLLVNGFLYKVYRDYKNNRYINVQVSDDKVQIGMHTFTEKLYVSNVYGNCNIDNNDSYSTEDVSKIRLYDITQLQNGENIVIYLLWDNGFQRIIAQDEYISGSASEQIYEDEVKYVDNGIFDTISGTATNCFKIYDRLNKGKFGENGWRQLAENDIDYIKANGVKNYFKGNNPHTGHFRYDGGFSYVDYFANLFNVSYNEMLFNEREYDGGFYDELDYIGQIGFKNLTAGTDECAFNYPLYEDTKIHFFGDWFNVIDSSDKDVHKYNNKDYTSWYDNNDYAEQISSVTKNASACTVYDDSYEDDRIVCSGLTPDGQTEQIVNTKVIEITINLLSKIKCDGESNQIYTKDTMEEIKYYQDVVMFYVAQMIPSTAIMRVNYKLKDDCNVIINVN